MFAPCGAVLGWQLSPTGTVNERSLSARSQSNIAKFFTNTTANYAYMVGDSIHEEITNRSLGCEGVSDICGNPDDEPDNAYIIAGVRWNDDPPFRFGSGSGNYTGCIKAQTVRLVTQPVCWLAVFKAAEKEAKSGKVFNGSNSVLLVRSHFGDMQFLHSMANKDAESAQDTKDRIMLWAEFTWGVATGIHTQDTNLFGLKKYKFDQLFLFNKEWRVQDIFALSNRQNRQGNRIQRVAFGSLLHVIQDSFAGGHVERLDPSEGQSCPTNSNWMKPGNILEFHSYSKQDHTKHGDSDNKGAFEQHHASINPGAVQVGAELFKLFSKRAPWSEVSPYLECIFTLDAQSRISSSGEPYIANN